MLVVKLNTGWDNGCIKTKPLMDTLLGFLKVFLDQVVDNAIVVWVNKIALLI